MTRTAMTKAKLGRRILKNYQLYLLLIPVVCYYVIFHYIPMYGVTLAFKSYNVKQGILGSPWVGLQYFKRFFTSYDSGQIIINTLRLSVYGIVAGFPAPILLSLLVNEIRSSAVKKTVQTVTYAPHFISTVVFVAMINMFLSPSAGVINLLIDLLGGERIHFMGIEKYFDTIYVLSGIWQQAGWNSIIYLAALSSVDTQLYDAAYIDGVNRLQKIWHIDFPCILPTAVIMLIMNSGNVMNVGFQKIFLMQNNMNIYSTQVISTYVYNVGLVKGNFSYATAIGLFNSVVSIIMVLSVNAIAKKVGETSLW